MGCANTTPGKISAAVDSQCAGSKISVSYFACPFLLLRSVFPSQRAVLFKRADDCIRNLRRLQEPCFLSIAGAQTLVTDAARGRIADQSRWSAVVDKLYSNKLDLFALALAWHQSLYAPKLTAAEMQQCAEQDFRDRGCVNPTKLMQLILPLP